MPDISLANEVSNPSVSSQNVRSNSTSSVEIKNGANNKHSSGSQSKSCISSYTVAYNEYVVRPAKIDKRALLMEEYKSDSNLFNSDVDDDPEDEFPVRVKRTSTFRRRAFNSFRGKNKAPVRPSKSLKEPHVIVNVHV